MELGNIGKHLKEYQRGGRIMVVTDQNVAKLYVRKVAESLVRSGYAGSAVILPAGESSKSADMYVDVLNRVAEAELTRGDGIIALGGGMVGDIAGFVAATYMRGINLYEVPTTLLAMVDSSIGGKNGIDLKYGKNLVGSFYDPRCILRDVTTLDSLPDEIYLEGMAEIIKYAMISDTVLFELLESLAEREAPVQALRAESRWQQAIIDKCCEIKHEYVKVDPYDHGIRKMLNFGHTVGHAIERLSGYKVPHGQAVAKGMNYIAQLSAWSGWCDGETADRMEALLKAWGFDLSIVWSGDELAEAIAFDKKRTTDRISLITPARIGSCDIREMNLQEL